MVTLDSNRVSVVIDPAGGFLHDVAFHGGTRTLRPMHRAPWLAEPPNPALPVGLQRLADDMFCAPFGDSDVEPAPPHGWTANGLWRLLQRVAEPWGTAATLELDRTVMGARVTKTVTLLQGHPWVYQSHLFEGGAGRIPVAYHAMLSAPGGVVLSGSPKVGGWTPPVPLEDDPARGRSLLRYGQRFGDPAQVALADGGLVDVRRLPLGPRGEDLFFLAEADGNTLGWTAALAAKNGYAYLAVKDPAVLPFTGVWVSEGGRDYPPWSGRHRGVVGLEECRVGWAPDHAAALAGDGPFGHAPALALGGRVEVAYAFTAWPAATGDDAVVAVLPDAGAVEVVDAAGRRATLPCHPFPAGSGQS